MSNPKKTTTKRKPANSYKRPEPIPPGEILKDVGKKSWRLGPVIGAGGFGDIYSAAEVTDLPTKKSAPFPFVVKIEPHDNGPLFVEMHFYMRVCRDEDMSSWKSERKLSALSVPRLLGWGSHDVRQVKHRFLVMERFGADVWTEFTRNGRQMPAPTVARIAEQVLSALEYIHSKGYVHADVKGANLLLTASRDRVVLVDFGLACPVSEKADPKRAHNGTAEYASRDAHRGAMTFRGDLETVCLNAVQWLSGRLPWEARLDNLTALHADKEKHLAAPAAAPLLAACFKASSGPGWLSDWLRALAKLSTAAAPDYAALLRSVRAATGFTTRGALEFAAPAPKARSAQARRNGAKEADDGDATPPKRSRPNRGATAQNGASSKHNGHTESSDSSSEDSSPAARPKPKRAASRKAAPKVVKPSWRDGTAVSASNVSRPGEYQRANK